MLIRSKKLRSQPNISNMLAIGDGLYATKRKEKLSQCRQGLIS